MNSIIDYKQCPKCGSKNSVKIIYGFPDNEAFEKAQAGKIKLGGCILFEGNPEYYCRDCEYEWSREKAIDAAYRKIKRIKASVGGYLGGYYHVDIDLTTGKVSWIYLDKGKENTIHKAISSTVLKRFIDELKSVNLLNWKSKYVETGVCDGTHWRVEIIRNGRNIRKYGDNKFPEKWDIFCSIIMKLINKQFR